MADNENSSHDNAIGWMILLVIFAVIAYLMWTYLDTEIRNAIRWLRYGQMWLISHFVDPGFTVSYNGEPVSWWQGFKTAAQWNAEELTYDHLSYFNSLAMQPLKYFYVGLLGLGALWCMFFGTDRHYRQKLGLEGLIRRQASNFPVIAPFVKFNPANQPPRPPGSPVPAEMPPFAEALGPEEWIAYNNIPIPDGNLDQKAAFKAFKKQLGPRWKGAKALAPHKQILLAAFCLKAARKRSQSDEMMGRLAQCWTVEKGLKLSRDRSLLREARKVLADKSLSDVTLQRANRHAYETTALMGALATAREEGGVLAPAQFVWLRAYDRTLWYPLNNLGRESNHAEALGAMAHYRSEKRTQRPIPVPKMEEAVESIITYMKSKFARPIPQLDYSKSKKRGIKKVA